jgi:hypothetical protein
MFYNSHDAILDHCDAIMNLNTPARIMLNLQDWHAVYGVTPTSWYLSISRINGTSSTSALFVLLFASFGIVNKVS